MVKLLGRFFLYCIRRYEGGEGRPAYKEPETSPEKILSEWLYGAERKETSGR